MTNYNHVKKPKIHNNHKHYRKERDALFLDHQKDIQKTTYEHGKLHWFQQVVKMGKEVFFILKIHKLLRSFLDHLSVFIYLCKES